MPVFDKWKKLQNIEALEKLAKIQLIWVRRPLLIHERSTTGKKCKCGCNSVLATVVEERGHIDVLIDPMRGTRKVREDIEDKELFDKLCKKAHRLYMPRRCSWKQLEALECQSKVRSEFGGVRGGKTTNLAEETTDQSLRYGGPGVQIWWVAPSLEKTEIGLRKLVRGETVGKGRTKREVKPILTQELVRYVPSSTRADNKFIELIDGTRICLKYASRDGQNLKGDPPAFAALDEGCAVKDPENYRQLLDRLMEADGRLIIATTPVAGHFLKNEVYDPGCHVSEWDGRKHAWSHLTCFDNPWVSEEAIQSTIESINDEQRVKREIYGEWVGSGPRLWSHFNEALSVVDELPDLDWVTSKAVGHFFYRDDLDRWGGMDFNLNPMSFVELKIGVPKGLDKEKQSNWILVQCSELVEKSGSIHKFSERLKEEGYEDMAISCDPSGAQFSPYRQSHGVGASSTHTQEMQLHGFQVEPCHVSEHNRPKQPPVLDRIDVMHKLMRDRVGDLPRFMILKKCYRTIDSLRIQESDERGLPVKEPGTEQDRQAGPTDALGYGVWPIFRNEYEIVNLPI